ncbi:hypothetical protein TNCV_1710021 [Trichonephila clavipes]|nr:hypothetical protein TNCV_1710021 [Trichonephila clavipes]
MKERSAFHFPTTFSFRLLPQPFELSSPEERLEQEGNNALKRFITEDEAWLYYYDPTIKQQSTEWKHPSSPTPKKAKTVKSAGRVMWP